MDYLYELAQEGRWEEALIEVQRLQQTEIEENVNFFILAAEVLSNLNMPEQAYEYISDGLKEDPFNYELYFMLGNYYSEKTNKEKAYLCFEMAAFYSKNSEDEEFFSDCLLQYSSTANVVVPPTSIVIVSYNSSDVMKNCITSIRESNPKSAYEIVVVDNASTDGIAQWLQQQEDIIFQGNDYNAGFALACNQGVQLAQAGNDIFFLNNDTIVPPNALFWLRMGLYEDDKTGAVGSITNHAANGQQVEETFSRIEDWLLYANRVNVPMKNYFEKKIWLVGFALLIKREVLNKVGLFDFQFGKGNFEDNDLGIRILQAGYELHLCKNSFIYHFGSLGFKQNNPEEYVQLMRRNKDLLKKKWGIDITYYTHARADLIDLIEDETDKEIHVLEVGCGAGATLSRIQYMWPNAVVKGIELDSKVAALGAKYLDIVEGNIESMTLEYERNYFDYVIFGDVLEHLFEPDKTLQKIRPFLKDKGCVLASIPNIMHVSVLLPLLKGRFDYQDAGILDRTHVRFFTLTSILEMMKRNHFVVETVQGTHCVEGDIDSNKELYDLLISLLGEQFALQSKAYQYLIKARFCDEF